MQALKIFVLNTIVIVGLVHASASLLADPLQWDKTNVEFPVPTKAADVPATFDTTFHYKNVSSNPVTIEKIKTSCHCTIAKPSKTDVAPGEEGDLTVQFTPGEQVGSQTKKVFVHLKGQAKPDILTLHANLPIWMQISPEFVNWNPTDKQDPQTIHFKVPDNVPPVTKINIDSGPDVTAQQKVVTPGKSFDLIFTPKKFTADTVIPVTVDCWFDTPSKGPNPSAQSPNASGNKEERHYTVYAIYGAVGQHTLPVIQPEKDDGLEDEDSE